MVLDVFYLALIVFAFIAIQTGVLRNAIIYLSVFSLICSIVYLLLAAPDVAIAEAVIGCTLSTILYLVALKKYKIFTVYYYSWTKDEEKIQQVKTEREKIRTILTKFSSAKELQLDIINTSSTFKQLKESVTFDVVVFHTEKGVWIHGLKNSYQYNELVKIFEKEKTLSVNCCYIDEDEVELTDI